MSEARALTSWAAGEGASNQLETAFEIPVGVGFRRDRVRRKSAIFAQTVV